MAATGSVPAGTRVGRYEIVSLLRQGGMGEVYAAHDSNLGRRVALKILPKNRTGDPDRVARFVREARASSTLNHPAIVSVHDAGSEGDLQDRKSTRLNSSHGYISYAVFCLKKKK